jgi:hypothetical protein
LLRPFSSEQFINPTPPSPFTAGAKLVYTQNKELEVKNTEYRIQNTDSKLLLWSASTGSSKVQAKTTSI